MPDKWKDSVMRVSRPSATKQPGRVPFMVSKNVGGSDPAGAFINAVIAAGGSMTPAVQSEWRAFVAREIAGNRWAKIKRLYPYLGGVINSAIIDAITLTPAINNNFVDGDVDALIGLTSDGSTKAILDFAPFSSISSNPSDIQYYTYYLIAPISGMFYGARSTSAPVARVYVEYSAGNILTLLGGGVGNSFATPLLNQQSLIASITDNGATSNVSTYIDGVLKDSDNVTKSTTLTNREPGYFAYNINGTLSNFSNQKSAVNALFQGMTSSEMIDFDTSYKTLLTNIGAI